MPESVKLQELNLLLMYNLINTITSPTMIINNTVSFSDVILINHQNYKILSTVLHFRYSDHQAQILNINVDKPKRGPVKVRKKQFTEESTEEFKYL
jgi:hypothetical protein